MKLLCLFLLLSLYSQHISPPERRDEPIFRRFRPSAFAGQAILTKRKYTTRGPLVSFGLLVLLVIGLCVGGWLLVGKIWQGLLLTAVGLALCSVEFVRLTKTLYAQPTERSRGDDRYRHLIESLKLADMTRYGIGDDLYRFTIAANRQTLVVADYGQDTGFIIPRNYIVSISEESVGDASADDANTTDVFRATSGPARQARTAGEPVHRITIRLQQTQPAMLLIDYKNRMFADTFDAFVSHTIWVE